MKKNERPGMKNITINIPEIYDKNILELQELGVTPSRSEFIRNAIGNHIRKEELILERLGINDRKLFSEVDNE